MSMSAVSTPIFCDDGSIVQYFSGSTRTSSGKISEFARNVHKISQIKLFWKKSQILLYDVFGDILFHVALIWSTKILLSFYNIF